MVKIINEMSVNRNSAINDLNKISEIMRTHIIKIIVYKNTTNDYKGWCDEVANYLFTASDIRLKPKNRKLKEKDYEEHLFSSFGTTLSDTRLALLATLSHLENKKGFYHVKYSDELLKEVFKVLTDFMNTFLKIISKNEKYDLEFMEALVFKYFKNYNIKIQSEV